MHEIVYVDGPRLRAALVAACDHVQQHRAELNRINVFPVPDGDTGTNLALTVATIADTLRANRGAGVAEVARATAEAGILGARGNCGMILSHFLLGFSEALGDRQRISVPEFVEALRAAVAHVYGALERPVEGTIITVMRAIAEEAASLETEDFVGAMHALVARARQALEETPDLLPALRDAGVVDAGAKGFVHLMEGIAAHMAGEPAPPAPQPAGEPLVAAAASAEYSAAMEHFRFCTEALVRGEGLPTSDAVRETLREWGDSLVVIRSGELLKVHIHTDEPERVLDHLRTLGSLTAHKAEDMRAQHAAVERQAHLFLARRPLSVVTDSGCDLPEDTVRAHGIHRVPLNLIFGDRTLRDGVDITSAEFARRLAEGVQATTSQPAPAAFLEAYARAAEDGEEVLVVTLAAALSGTFASAEAAAKRFDGAPIHLVDSRGASLCQGMLALRAAELSEMGHPPAEIAEELARVRDRSGIFFTLSTYDRLVASGRVGRGRALLGSLLDIKPILGLDAAGTVDPVARVRGARNVLPRMLDLVAERIPAGAERVRFGVVHVAAEETAAEVVEALRERFGARDVLVSPVTPVIATHTGPGTWGIAYQVED